jgi:hypothetical protein
MLVPQDSTFDVDLRSRDMRNLSTRPSLVLGFSLLIILLARVYASINHFNWIPHYYGVRSRVLRSTRQQTKIGLALTFQQVSKRGINAGPEREREREREL